MAIHFKALLSDAGIEPKSVKVLRHTIDHAGLPSGRWAQN